MIAAVSLVTLVSGGVLSGAAVKLPLQAAALERCGGMLMVTGLALLGAGLQWVQP